MNKYAMDSIAVQAKTYAREMADYLEDANFETPYSVFLTIANKARKCEEQLNELVDMFEPDDYKVRRKIEDAIDNCDSIVHHIVNPQPIDEVFHMIPFVATLYSLVKDHHNWTGILDYLDYVTEWLKDRYDTPEEPAGVFITPDPTPPPTPQHAIQPTYIEAKDKEPKEAWSVIPEPEYTDVGVSPV